MVRLTGMTLLSFLILEVVARVLLYPKLLKSPFRPETVASRAQTQIAQLENGLQPKQSTIGQWKLHPYVGYTVKPGVGANNLGFHSPFQYPYHKRNRNEFVVAVLGGSVADRFSEFTEKKTIPENQKKLVFLNLANGSYKQPQQLFVLQFALLSGFDIDAVLNIDGYNEVAGGELNHSLGIHPLYPSVHFLELLSEARLSELTGEQLEMAVEMKGLSRRQLQLAKIASSRPLRVSALAQLLSTLYHQRLESKRQSLQSKLVEQLFVQFGPDRFSHLQIPLLHESLEQEVARLWYESSRAISRICAENKISYWHFLQPVRQPSPRIRAIYKSYREYGERLLLAQPLSFEDLSIHLTDSQLFEDQVHLTAQGNDQLFSMVERKFRNTDRGAH